MTEYPGEKRTDFSDPHHNVKFKKEENAVAQATASPKDSSASQKRVIVIEPPADEPPSSSSEVKNYILKESFSSNGMPTQTSRRLARGFTITVSPPISDYTQPSLDPSECTNGLEKAFARCGSGTSIDSSPVGGSNTADSLFPRKRTAVHDSDSYLAPDELVPSVALDFSVSRLPSLEDMLVDEELSKVLYTSPIHQCIRDMLIVDCDQTKYENLIFLVQKSYEDAEWRTAAASDRQIVDTLVLLIRQRLTAARNPHQDPGSDFMPKSSFLLNASYSRSFIATTCSSTFKETSSDKPSNFNVTSNERIVRSAIHVAILSAVVKLLRNICVNSKDCQLYIHEHRIIDLLVEHIDMVMEITYRQRDLSQCANNHTSISGLILSREDVSKCPEWASGECQAFTRALFQLIINVATGNPKIQSHILHCLFPENLLNAIIFTDDLSTIFSLLHCLISQQESNRLLNAFVQNTRGVKAFYFLWAVMTAERAKCESEKKCESADTALGFLNNIVFRKMASEDEYNFTILRDVVDELYRLDPKTYISSASETLKHAASFKTPPNFSGMLTSRRNSLEVPEEWAEFVRQKVESFIAIPKAEVLATFTVVLRQVFERKISTQEDMQFCSNATLSPLTIFPHEHCFYTFTFYLLTCLEPSVSDYISKNSNQAPADESFLHSPPMPARLSEITDLDSLLSVLCLKPDVDENETVITSAMPSLSTHMLYMSMYIYLYKIKNNPIKSMGKKPLADQLVLSRCTWALIQAIVKDTSANFATPAVVLLHIFLLDKPLFSKFPKISPIVQQQLEKVFNSVELAMQTDQIAMANKFRADDISKVICQIRHKLFE